MGNVLVGITIKSGEKYTILVDFNGVTMQEFLNLTFNSNNRWATFLGASESLTVTLDEIVSLECVSV